MYDMLPLFATAKGTLVIVAIAIFSLGSGIFADAMGADTPITLGGAMGVGASVIVGAWYLSARLQKIDSRLKVIETQLKDRHYRYGRTNDE